MRALFLSLLFTLLIMSSTLLAGAPKLPQRIASGTVGTDEILYEILSRRHELNRLVAVSIFSENKRYSHIDKIPDSIKGRVSDSVEALVALKPDLAILASYNRAEISHQLKAAGIQVAIQENFRSISDIQDNIKLIGHLIGADKEAQDMIREMQTELDASKPKTVCKKGHPTFIQYSEYDTIPGADTIINDAADQAGFTNLARTMKLKGWAPLSQEVLATLDPDFIIIAGNPEQKTDLHNRLKQSPAWQKLKAVKLGQLIIVPERQLYTVSHHVVKLVQSLAAVRSCPR